METPITETPAATAEGAGNEVTAGIEGAVTQAATTEAPKTFTQVELDQIIKARLAEHGRTLKTKHDKELETQIATARDAAQTDLEKLVEERVTARLAEQELTKTRTTLMAEYGLSDEQVARLQGTTPEELSKDAELVFGSLKQLPKIPVIRTGSEGTVDSPTDMANMSPAEIRANSDKLWKQAAR
jgi:hypothetical protein